jgi:HEAT repeat protein
MSDTPRQRIEAASARVGREAFVRQCLELLEGRRVEADLVRVLAGRSAQWGLSAGPESDYWMRVWAVRGLLWAWDPIALAALRRSCRDDAWRVREMAAKVVARHRLGEALEDVAALQSDDVPRVRAAAHRAVAMLTAHTA